MNDYDDYDDERDDEDEDAGSTESLVWQLLLLINPGDKDGALQQFNEYRDLVEEEGDDDPMRLVAHATDWRSGFEVDAGDTRGLVDAINELVSRWSGVTVDWDGDPDDDDFHEEVDVPELFSRAYDELDARGYTLWGREADDGVYAGFITRSTDAELMRLIATDLGINLRLGRDVF